MNNTDQNHRQVSLLRYDFQLLQLKTILGS